MTQDLLLMLSGGIIGFLLGTIAMLLLRDRPSVRRSWAIDSVDSTLATPEEMSRTERQGQSEDTQDQRLLPSSFVRSTTGRSAPIHFTARSRAPVAMLTAQEGMLDGRSWLLRYAASTTIGRFDDCDIAINDHGISRLHAQITHRTDAATAHEFAIFDYSSTNGTMVNGQPINAVASLQDGDLIHIGNSKFLFRRVRQDNSSDRLR